MDTAKPAAGRLFVRVFSGIALVVCLAFVGLVSGTLFGSLVMVKPGAGLTGPADALMWGVLMALGLVVFAGLAAVRLPFERLKKYAAAAAVVAALVAGALTVRVMYLHMETQDDASSNQNNTVSANPTVPNQ